MPNIFATAMSAVTMVMLGIVALHYRQQELEGASLSGNNAEAYNLSTEVLGDVTAITGNALPQLLMIVIIVVLILMLLITR